MKLFLLLSAIMALTMGDSQDLLYQANNQFTSKLFTEVVKNNPDKSVVLSAFSVLTPLAQLSLASVDETHDQLLRAIGLPNDNDTKAVFSDLNTRMRSVKGIELKMANKIYLADDAELNPEFASISRDVFGSDIKNVDFKKNTETANEINVWVEDQTNHRIKDLVSANDLDESTRSVLVNAIYFKGIWAKPFLKEHTVDGDFHVSSEKTVKVPMMHKKGTFNYAESHLLDAKLLELPYEGGESSMLIILPNKIDGLKDLEKKMEDPAILSQETDKMSSYEVDVTLPKFKIETKTDLKDVLEKIGVSDMFSSKAKLIKLLKNESNLYISKAIQKAFIEVNEEGAEAAAANAFVVVLESLNIQPLSTFVADRPFYFELRHQRDVLFNGVLAEPSTK